MASSFSDIKREKKEHGNCNVNFKGNVKLISLCVVKHVPHDDVESEIPVDTDLSSLETY